MFMQKPHTVHWAAWGICGQPQKVLNQHVEKPWGLTPFPNVVSRLRDLGPGNWVPPMHEEPTENCKASIHSSFMIHRLVSTKRISCQISEWLTPWNDVLLWHTEVGMSYQPAQIASTSAVLLQVMTQFVTTWLLDGVADKRLSALSAVPFLTQ